MANPTNFGTRLLQDAQQIVALMSEMETIQEMVQSDSTLLQAAYSAIKGERPDLVEQDLVNFMSAVQQILFTFTSGSPSQASYVYKLV